MLHYFAKQNKFAIVYFILTHRVNKVKKIIRQYKHDLQDKEKQNHLGQNH